MVIAKTFSLEGPPVKTNTESGQLWAYIMKLAKRFTWDTDKPYWKARNIVRHDRALNGELIYRERRHG